MNHQSTDPTSNRFAEERGREYVRIMRDMADNDAALLSARATVDPRLDIRPPLYANEWDPLEVALDSCVTSFDDMTSEQLHHLLNGIHDELQDQLNELVVVPAKVPPAPPAPSGLEDADPPTSSSGGDQWEATVTRCYELGRSLTLAVATTAIDMYGGEGCDLSLPDVNRRLGEISAASTADELRWVLAGANFQAEQCIAQVEDTALPQPRLHELTQTCPSDTTLVARGHAYIANLYWALVAGTRNDDALGDRLYEERDNLLNTLEELEIADLQHFVDGTIEGIDIWLNLLLSWTCRPNPEMRP